MKLAVGLEWLNTSPEYLSRTIVETARSAGPMADQCDYLRRIPQRARRSFMSSCGITYRRTDQANARYIHVATRPSAALSDLISSIAFLVHGKIFVQRCKSKIGENVQTEHVSEHVREHVREHVVCPPSCQVVIFEERRGTLGWGS